MRTQWQLLISGIMLTLSLSLSQAQTSIIDVCPNIGIQVRPTTFEPSGIILTSFDSAALWVYDIERNTRYPLPETRPCTSNCHLSPDAQWFSFLDPQTFAFSKMRLNGTQRTILVSDAADVRWWNPDTLIVWTTDQQAYLRPESDLNAEPEFLSSDGVMTIQPNGRFALRIGGDNGLFNRYMVNLDNPEQSTLLAADRTYFNAAAWSPNGQHLAYVGTGAIDESLGTSGAELFLTSPNNAIPEQMTFLTDSYGAVRINGYAPNDLSWSPDSTQIAFWVIELTGANPAENTSDAVLHVLNTNTREVRRYCGFMTTEHTPETPRIIWSPDSSHLAFAGNVAGDNKGALLLALNIETGTFIELSNGMFPVYGIPQLNAWGTVP